MKPLQEIKAIIQSNRESHLYLFEGLESSEIARWSGYVMYGENDEAFPDHAELKIITD